MMAQRERQYDEYERMAYGAMMGENASRIKKPKTTDLFKRPTDTEVAKKKTEALLEQTRHASDWLSQFTIGKKEATEGGR